MNIRRVLAIAFIFPMLVCAHPGERLQPDDLWSAWEFDPGVIIPLVLSAALYIIGSKRQFGISRRQELYFWAGWLTLFVALVSPLHPMGEALFSAHMLQHELLMIVAAPLLVLSRPLVTFLWAFPLSWRRSMGRFSKSRVIPSALGLDHRAICSMVDTHDSNLALPCSAAL